MAWFILAAAYLAIGIGAFAWCGRGDKTTDSDQKKRSARVLVLFPELCLFWPVVVFMTIKRKKEANTIASHPVE
jgi:hypothetical protein